MQVGARHSHLVLCFKMILASTVQYFRLIHLREMPEPHCFIISPFPCTCVGAVCTSSAYRCCWREHMNPNQRCFEVVVRARPLLCLPLTSLQALNDVLALTCGSLVWRYLCCYGACPLSGRIWEQRNPNCCLCLEVCLGGVLEETSAFPLELDWLGTA